MRINRQPKNSAQPEPQHTPAQQDILAFFKIPLTMPLNNVLTVQEMDTVTFRPSKPQGYYPNDVDEWHRQTRQSIKTLFDALEQRDQHIHKLATEYDLAQDKISTQKAELEIFHARGALLIDDQGNPATADSDAAMAFRLNEENQQLKQTIQQLQNNPTSTTDTGLSNEERQHLNNMEAWAEQMNEAYEALLAENEQLKETLRNTQPDSQEATPVKTQNITEAGQDDNSAYEAPVAAEPVTYEEPAATVPDTAEPVPTYYEDEQGNKYLHGQPLHEDISYQSTSATTNHYAPELPPGVILPSQQFLEQQNKPLAAYDPSAPLINGLDE